jgi:hypothetical protein
MMHPFELLVDIVKPNGEFRIHTNKDGIRLFVRFVRKGWTGYHLEYIVRNTPDGKACVHPEDLLKVVSVYKESIQGSDLQQCVVTFMNSLPYQRSKKVVTPARSDYFSVVGCMRVEDFRKLPLRYPIQNPQNEPTH